MHVRVDMSQVAFRKPMDGDKRYVAAAERQHFGGRCFDIQGSQVDRTVTGWHDNGAEGFGFAGLRRVDVKKRKPVF